LPIWQSCGHDRHLLRTSTFEFAIVATYGSNQHSPKEEGFST